MEGIGRFLKTRMLEVFYYRCFNIQEFPKIPTLVTRCGGPAWFTPSVTSTRNPVTSSGQVAVVTTSILAIFTVISVVWTF